VILKKIPLELEIILKPGNGKPILKKETKIETWRNLERDNLLQTTHKLCPSVVETKLFPPD